MGFTFPFTKHEWLVLYVVLVTHLLTGMINSLAPALFPPEAEKRGSSAMEYGLMFGFCRLTNIISTPLAGKYISKIGPKFLTQFVICASGISIILLGLLDLVTTHAWFIILAVLVMDFMYINNDTSMMATTSILAQVFPKTMGTLFATVEIALGVGTIVGPVFGEHLSSLGGFLCVFVVLGLLVTAHGSSVHCVLPDAVCEPSRDFNHTQITSVMQLPAVMLDSFTAFTHGICAGFLSSTLQPHIKQFGLSSVASAAVLSIGFVTHALSAPLVGRLCDIKVNAKKIIICGSLLNILGFSLIGPSPVLPIDPALWMVCIGLALYGCAYTCLIVAAFYDALHSAVECGLPNDITTCGIVCGIWISSQSLGSFIGPSVAGVLFRWIGFRAASLFVVIIQMILCGAMTWYIFVDKRPVKKIISVSQFGCKEFDYLAVCQSEEDRGHAQDNDGTDDDVTDEDSDTKPLIPKDSAKKMYTSVDRDSVNKDNQY